ncbi:MAB_1171c family putative transporter [Nocardia transvalensis]|uniref:MAB_1171c family putative transporter n=1 Tax=Nocardia transvalensis TaxID=37333 RepID=UPI00189511F1|nr:MAB_1171c family putative transporter [Nocardia transvalensis]MBF6332360.1 hypothetical protein [Nocardia transvalensis]
MTIDAVLQSIVHNLRIVSMIGWALGLVWVVYQTLRTPWNIRMRWMTGLFAAVALQPLFVWASGHSVNLLGLTSLGNFLLVYCLALIGDYCLICFALFVTRDSHTAGVWARRYALVLVSVIAVLTVLVLLTPATASYRSTTLPTVAAFHMITNLTGTACYVVALVWTRRCIRHAGPRLARGLSLASFGMAGTVLSGSFYIVVDILGYTTNTVPGVLAKSVTVVYYVGSLLLLVGLCYPTVAMRAASWRIWWKHRRAYDQLYPLWNLLQTAFPEDLLDRVPASRWRDRMSLRNVHRRFYRRVIECRDGLVRISPYIAKVRSDGLVSAALADQLAAAFDLRAAGEADSEAAVAIASPPTPGLDADVGELITLSRALKVSANGAR